MVSFCFILASKGSHPTLPYTSVVNAQLCDPPVHAVHMCLHSVKADGKQMESTADGALDSWSCFMNPSITGPNNIAMSDSLHSCRLV